MPRLTDLDVTYVPSYLRNSTQKRETKASSKSIASKTGVIGNSDNVTGIEIRMLPPLIKNNRVEKIFPFPGFAQLYCLTIVVSDLPNEAVGGIDLKGFPRIGDQEPLPINKTIFYWQMNSAEKAVPNQIHFVSRVMKSKKGLRDTGEILASLNEDKEYKTTVEKIGSLLKNATNFNLISEGLTTLSGVVGKLLKNIEDKPLGAVIQSYTTLRGDFDQLGVNRHVYPTPNVDFNFEVIVRDAAVKQEKTTPPEKKGLTGRAAKIEQQDILVDVDMMPLK